MARTPTHFADPAVLSSSLSADPNLSRTLERDASVKKRLAVVIHQSNPAENELMGGTLNDCEGQVLHSSQGIYCFCLIFFDISLFKHERSNQKRSTIIHYYGTHTGGRVGVSRIFPFSIAPLCLFSLFFLYLQCTQFPQFGFIAVYFKF